MGSSNPYNAEMLAQSRQQQYLKEAQHDQLISEAKWPEEEAKANAKPSKRFNINFGFLLMRANHQ